MDEVDLLIASSWLLTIFVGITVPVSERYSLLWGLFMLSFVLLNARDFMKRKLCNIQ